jgi:YD repeat-containing protein
MDLFEHVKGESCEGDRNTTLDSNSNATSSQGTWYDVYVRCDGSNIQVWRAQRGSGNELAQVLSTSSASVNSTSELAVYTYGTWRFDDFRVVSDGLSTTTTYSYDNANELLTMAKGGTNTAFTYNDWGRTITKAMPGHTATYLYRFGDKLKQVSSDFPDEQSLTQYTYDGFGKLRDKVVNSTDLTWYRWDTGWNLIEEYDDPDLDWDIENLSMTYIGHLAEVPGSSPSTCGEIWGRFPDFL